MDSEVSNGSGLGVEHITDLLVFGFLQSCSDYNFYPELEALGQELPVRVYLQDQDDELQTDGNRASRCLFSERIEPDSERQEVIQHIARHLAQVGDKMDRSIQPTLVQYLAVQFMNTSLSDEDKRTCLATALEKMRKTYPKDIEPEKATLIMTMLLAKKVADLRPSLLRDVFRTTVNFINQNLFAYVRNLVRNEMN